MNPCSSSVTNFGSVRPLAPSVHCCSKVSQVLLDHAKERSLFRLPRAPPWVGEFVRELQAFTGREGGHDDQVDAASNALNESIGVTQR